LHEEIKSFSQFAMEGFVPEEEEVPKREPYDNDVTLLYKWADFYKIPTKYIIVTETEEELNYIAIPGIIDELLEEGKSLWEIYSTIPNINRQDVIMFAYEIEQERGSLDQEKMLETINEFLSEVSGQEGGLSRFRDWSEFVTNYEVWKREFDESLEHEKIILEDLKRVLEVLERLSPLPVSPITFDEITIEVTPQILSEDKEQRPVEPPDGIEIFNRARLSKYVPYLQYSSSTQDYYKLYRGETLYQTLHYENILPSSLKTPERNMMLMTVWTGKGDISAALKESFLSGTYTLSNNILTIKTPLTPEQNETYVLDRLKEAFPTLTLDRGKEVNVHGTFYIYGIEISEISLLDIILTDPLFYTYLYIDESNLSYANKVRLYIHYRPVVALYDEVVPQSAGGYRQKTSVSELLSSTVNVKLKQLYSEKGGTYREYDPQSPGGYREVVLEPGTAYLQVRIIRATSRRIVRNFVEIFRRLLSFYRERKRAIDDEYRAVIPEIDTIAPRSRLDTVPREIVSPTSPSPRSPRIVPSSPGGIEPSENLIIETRVTVPGPGRGRPTESLAELQALAPQLFVSGYARKVQPKYQVSAIPESQVIQGEDGLYYWKDAYFIKGGVRYPRQVLKFPPYYDNQPDVKPPETWYFVCLNDEAPYPGVTENKIEPSKKGIDNRQLFPYIPKCFAKDQMNPTANTHYNQYYRGIPRRKAGGAQSERGLITDKVLEPNETGIPPKTISDLLKTYTEQSGIFYRFGVPRSKNSFIHCVLTALDIKEYFDLPPENREDFVLKIRQHILATIHPELLRQELYDFRREDIIRNLADPNIFFDPKLYYRALEEIFDVNIFVFVPPSSVEKSVEQLEMPRAKLFSARPYREERDTILIYKHTGAFSEPLPYPQCELLIEELPDRSIFKRFGPQMTEIVYEALQKMNPVYSWTLHRDVVSDPEGNLVETDFVVPRLNLFSAVDYFGLTQRSAKAQFIDEYGKLRALLVPTPSGDIPIIVHPSQPENLPILDRIDPVPISYVLALFPNQEPVARSTNEKGQTTGLWYSVLDIPFGIYVPVIPTSEYGELNLGPPNPIMTSGTPAVARLRRLRRTLSLILQLLEWIYVLAQPITPQEFARQYFTLGPPTDDTATYYDFRSISHKLPKVSTAREAISALESQVPTLFQKGKIVLYSKKFASKLEQHLLSFDRLYRPLPIPPSKPGENDWPRRTHLDGLFEDESDFLSDPHVLLFIGERNFQNWIQSLSRAIQLHIRTKLDLADGLLEEPYLYISPDKKIYLIQNVYRGEFLRAMEVASQWTLNRINPGSNAPPFRGDLLVHVVYGISKAETPIVIEDQSYGNPEYLQILTYGQPNEPSVRYGAMLPLL